MHPLIFIHFYLIILTFLTLVSKASEEQSKQKSLVKEALNFRCFWIQETFTYYWPCSVLVERCLSATASHSVCLSLTLYLCCLGLIEVKMQNPKTKNTSIVIPKVRYHPSIQIQTPAAQVKTTKPRSSDSKQTRPAAGQGGDNDAQVDSAPAARPGPHGQKQSRQKPANRTNQKPNQRTTTDLDLPKQDPPRPEQIPLGLELQLDKSVVEQVEVLTRGQRINQDWFSWRKNRITASVVHRISHCHFVTGKSKTPPRSYLADITGKPHP